MKNAYQKMFSGLALAVLFLTFMRAPAFAQQEAQDKSHNSHSQAGKIEGVWDVSATPVDCETGESVLSVSRSMNMFIQGGSLYGTVPAQAPPMLRDAFLGVWRHLEGRRYHAVMTFFLYKPDGSIAGTRVITRELELSKDTDEFSGTGAIQDFDLDGNPVGPALCAIEHAVRRL